MGNDSRKRAQPAAVKDTRRLLPQLCNTPSGDVCPTCKRSCWRRGMVFPTHPDAVAFFGPPDVFDFDTPASDEPEFG